jgi:hypothetical protein
VKQQQSPQPSPAKLVESDSADEKEGKYKFGFDPKKNSNLQQPDDDKGSDVEMMDDTPLPSKKKKATAPVATKRQLGSKRV